MTTQIAKPRRMRVSKEFTFEAAHFLPNVPEGHKCRNMHGHHYTVRLTVEGPLQPKLDWVQDYADLKAAWDRWHMVFDHHCLNDITGLPNTTAENLALFIWDRLKPHDLPLLSEVAVSEIPGTWAIYAGDAV